MSTLRTPPPQGLPPQGRPREVIQARAATYYRMTRYIMLALLLGFGGWFFYDGFYNWPAENMQIEQWRADLDSAKRNNDEEKRIDLEEKLKPGEHKYHTDWDLRLQRGLAFFLPTLGVGLAAWAFYNSRGVYRLADGVLTAPGHPPVPVKLIKRIDRALWDRKGIAYITYDVMDGKGDRTIKLDDFVYQREPIDQIFEKIAGTGAKG